jgi:hypothetical protein
MTLMGPMQELVVAGNVTLMDRFRVILTQQVSYTNDTTTKIYRKQENSKNLGGEGKKQLI